MTTNTAIFVQIPDCQESSSFLRGVDFLPSISASGSNHQTSNDNLQLKMKCKKNVRGRLQRFLYSGTAVQREEKQRFLHPAYQRFAKRHFFKKRVRFGTSKLAVGADLLRAAACVKRRTLLYRPLPRVPLYYCRRCALASDIISKLSDHICAKKAVINSDHTDMEKLQKLVQIGPRSKLRDAQAILERLSYPQWARISRYPSSIHYNLIQCFTNPTTLMEIAYKNVEKHFITNGCSFTKNNDSKDVHYTSNEDTFEIVECDGATVFNCYDLSDQLAYDSEVASISDAMLNDDCLIQLHKVDASPIKIEKFSKNESTMSATHDEIKTSLESQLRSEFDASESSIPNSPELGLPLMSRRKSSLDSLDKIESSSFHNEHNETPQTSSYDSVKKECENQRNQCEQKSISEKLSGLLDSVGYYCQTCERVFMEYANYDLHIIESEKSNDSCSNAMTEPIKMTMSVNEVISKSGQLLRSTRYRPSDQCEMLECTKCHKTDFPERELLHAHIFECTLTAV